MYKDFKKCLKGKLHIIIMCIISRKIRQLWTKKIAKFESDAYSYRAIELRKFTVICMMGGTNFAHHRTNLCNFEEL